MQATKSSLQMKDFEYIFLQIYNIWECIGTEKVMVVGICSFCRTGISFSL